MLGGEAAGIAERVLRVEALNDERLLLQQPLLHTRREAAFADRAGDGVRVRVVGLRGLRRVRTERHRDERRRGRVVTTRRAVLSRPGHRTRDARPVRRSRLRR